MVYIKKITDPSGIIGDHFISESMKIHDSKNRIIGYIDDETAILDYKKCISLDKLEFEIVELRGDYKKDKLIINQKTLLVEPYGGN